MVLYINIILYFTVPVALLLFVLHIPMSTYDDKIKLMCLIAYSIFYVSPLINVLAYYKAASYNPISILCTIGYAPIEQYLLHCMHAIITTFLHIHISKFTLPILHIGKCGLSLFHRLLTSYLFPIVSCYLFYLGWLNIISEACTFYCGILVCWTIPMVVFMWLLTSVYIVSCWKPTFITVLTSTIFFCILEAIIIKYEVRDIQPETRISIYCPGLSNLPIEDATLWFVTSLMIVLVSSTFDKAWTLISTFPALFQEEIKGVKLSKTIEMSFSISYAKIFIQSLLLPSSELPMKYIEVFEDVVSVLKNKSTSFYAATFILPPKIKQDVIALYAFCRVCDDLVDEASGTEEGQKNVKTISEWLDLIYSSLENELNTKYLTLMEARQKGLPKYIISFLDTKKAKNIDQFLLKRVPVNARPSFLLFSTVAHRICRYPFDELLRGFQWDLQSFTSNIHDQTKKEAEKKKLVKNEDELVYYSRLVAGCIGEMLVWCAWGHEFETHSRFSKIRKKSSKQDIERDRLQTLCKANNMGVSLQLINIARDIRQDAETLGRVYIPVEWFNESKIPTLKTLNIRSEQLVSPSPSHLKELLNVKKPVQNMNLDHFPYGTYTIRLLHLAKMYYIESIDAVHSLPTSIRRSIKAMVENYHEISFYVVKRDFVNTSQGIIGISDGHRVKVPKRHRIWITLKQLYGFI